MKPERLAPVSAAPSVVDFAPESLAVGNLDRLSARLYRKWGKRPLDILLTLLAMPVLLPLVAFFALAVSLDGHSPFYAQKRVGRGGRIYRMWKLRSMVPDAEAELARIIASDPVRRAEWDEKQKLSDDPRVTRIGRLIRATSLDELPQFWNVLTGEMSIVGPRPMMPDQEVLYPGRSYFRLRPGITGPWQVSDRNACSFADRARFDDAYDRDLSLGWDISLLLATVWVVLRRTGC